VKTSTGKAWDVKIRASEPYGYELEDRVTALLNRDPQEFSLMYCGKLIHPGERLSDLGIRDGQHVIHAVLKETLQFSSQLPGPAYGIQYKGPLHSGVSAATLRCVTINVKIMDLLATVDVVQEYCNEEGQPKTGELVLPISNDCIIHGLLIESGTRRVVGNVAERKSARERYEKAVADGHGAALVESKLPDNYPVFTVSVGNLLPKQLTKVTVSYTTKLALEGSRLLFSLPMGFAEGCVVTPYGTLPVSHALLSTLLRSGECHYFWGLSRVSLHCSESGMPVRRDRLLDSRNASVSCHHHHRGVFAMAIVCVMVVEPC
jgi:hypothetical protein